VQFLGFAFVGRASAFCTVRPLTVIFRSRYGFTSNNYFGEIEVFNGGTRNATVTSKTPLLCLTLEVSAFQEVMQKHNALQQVMRQMALGRGLTTISSIGRRPRKNKLLKLI
jgi:CRP-like cAMP-binding protein